MDVWSITLAALRRWYVLLVLLAITAFAVHSVGSRAEPEYEVSATALLTPGSVDTPVPNPYGTEDDAAAAVTIVVNGPEVRRAIAERGLASGYEVFSEPRTTILRFTVQAESPEVGVQTGDAVLEAAREELVERQTAADVPEESQFGLEVLTEPSVVGTVTESSVRLQAVVGGLGAVLAVVVAVLFDDIVGLLRRRTRRGGPDAATRREEAAAPAAEAQPRDGDGQHADSRRVEA